MKYELKELSTDMGQQEYEMFQDIPAKESGSTNLCYGLPFVVFKEYLEREISRKYQTISNYDTPTISYIFYVNEKPVGLVGIRTKIDNNWLKWSGNIYYKVRTSERKKGYGTIMLKYALLNLKKMGYREIYANSSKGNIASYKVIEKNDGIFLKEEEGSRYYKFVL